MFVRHGRPTPTTPFPYTTLFRSRHGMGTRQWESCRLLPEPCAANRQDGPGLFADSLCVGRFAGPRFGAGTCPSRLRSEEHTSELQSPCNLVCRLLLEKKKATIED